MNPIAHPKHPVPKEVAEGFLRYGEQEAAAAEQRSEVARRERPTADERRLRAGLHERLYRSAGVDVDQYRSQSSAAAKQQLDRLQEGARVSLPLGPTCVRWIGSPPSRGVRTPVSGGPSRTGLVRLPMPGSSRRTASTSKARGATTAAA